MAVKEGKCKNCGSIVFLDTKNEDAHCIFCNYVFPVKEALYVAEHPDEFDYPNEPQPEYTGPSLSPAAKGGKVTFANPKPSPRQAAKQKKPDYVLKKKEMPSMNLTGKQRWAVIGLFVMIIVIFVAIMLPLTMSRDASREKITDSFAQTLVSNNHIAKENLELGEDLEIKRMDNSYAIVVLTEIKDKEQAVKIFNDYCEARAEAMELEGKEVQKVTLRILAPNNAYLIDRPAEDGLADLSAVKEIP